MYAIDIGVLVEDFCQIGEAILVGIFENQNPVAFLAGFLAIVDRLANPHSPTIVNVNAGWTTA